MKVKLVSWMNEKMINDAIIALKNCDRCGEYSEGIAKLQQVKPNYLVNILPDSRPEWVNARNMLLNTEI